MTTSATSPKYGRRARSNGLSTALVLSVAAATLLAATGCDSSQHLGQSPSTSPPEDSSPDEQLPAALPSGASITEYSVPTPGAGAHWMTVGPDGYLWFVEKFADKIGRIIPDTGEITEFPLPSGSDPAVIVSGSDGYLWVLLSANGGGSGPQRIARVTPSGEIVEFPVPQGLNIVGIAKGDDGNLWYTEKATNRIGRMDTAGRILEGFQVPAPDRGLAAITNGPDGSLWFDEQKGHNIGRITLDGKIAEFPYPTPVVPETTNNHEPTAGPDGNVWFTDYFNGKIGRVTPEGAITVFAIPTENAFPVSIVAGTDQRLWFNYCVLAPAGDKCQDYSTKIGSITVQGEVTEYPLPNRVSGLGGIAVTPDGAVWFNEDESDRIGQLVPKQ